MFTNNEDFSKSVEEGIKLIETPQPPPSSADLEAMKALLAVVITATVDAKILHDPDLSMKIGSVRMALLAAYNIGKNSL